MDGSTATALLGLSVGLIMGIMALILMREYKKYVTIKENTRRQIDEIRKNVDRKYSISMGEIYLYPRTGGANRANLTFANMLTMGFRGMWLSDRDISESLTPKQKEKVVQSILISRERGKGRIMPTKLDFMVKSVSDFVNEAAERGWDSILFVSGLPYLVATNGEDRVRDFMKGLHKAVDGSRTFVVVDFNHTELPESLSAWLRKHYNVKEYGPDGVHVKKVGGK